MSREVFGRLLCHLRTMHRQSCELGEIIAAAPEEHGFALWCAMEDELAAAVDCVRELVGEARGTAELLHLAEAEPVGAG